MRLLFFLSIESFTSLTKRKCKGSKSDVFIEFLEQYPETFQLTGESVLLLRFEDSECVTSVRTVGEIGHGCEKDDQIRK